METANASAQALFPLRTILEAQKQTSSSRSWASTAWSPPVRIVHSLTLRCRTSLQASNL